MTTTPEPGRQRGSGHEDISEDFRVAPPEDLQAGDVKLGIHPNPSLMPHESLFAFARDLSRQAWLRGRPIS